MNRVPSCREPRTLLEQHSLGTADHPFD
jgi:hypothetical protein